MAAGQSPTSVLPVLMEANEDVVGVELLLCELEENCKAEAGGCQPCPGHPLQVPGPRPPPRGSPVFAALGQGAARDLDIEAAAAPHSSPGDVLGIREPGLDI